MLTKKYFNFNYPGERLLIIFVVFMAIIMVPYIIAIFSVISSSGSLDNLDLVGSFRVLAIVYIWIFLVLIMTILLRIFIFKQFVKTTKYDNDFFDFTGSIWKFLWINIRDAILSLASFGIYYSWFMENIARFVFSNIKYLGQALQFNGRGGALLKIFLLYYILPIGIFQYYYYTTFFVNMMDFDMESFWSMYLQMTGMILIMYVIMIPFCYKAFKWLIDLEYNGREIKLHDDSWTSLGIIAREMIITIATLGIYFPAAMVRLYIYFVSHIGIIGQEGKNFIRFDSIPVSKGFTYIWGQLLLSMISWGIYYPFAVCKIIKWFADKTYLLVYRDDEVETESEIEEIYEKTDLE
jgi:uncharacterized membrane protein YjgN (DUF898 family)